MLGGVPNLNFMLSKQGSWSMKVPVDMVSMKTCKHFSVPGQVTSKGKSSAEHCITGIEDGTPYCSLAVKQAMFLRMYLDLYRRCPLALLSFMCRAKVSIRVKHKIIVYIPHVRDKISRQATECK